MRFGIIYSHNSDRKHLNQKNTTSGPNLLFSEVIPTYEHWNSMKWKIQKIYKKHTKQNTMSQLCNAYIRILRIISKSETAYKATHKHTATADCK